MLFCLCLEDIAVSAPGGLDPVNAADDGARLRLVDLLHDEFHLGGVNLRGVNPGALEDVGPWAPCK